MSGPIGYRGNLVGMYMAEANRARENLYRMAVDRWLDAATVEEAKEWHRVVKQYAPRHRSRP